MKTITKVMNEELQGINKILGTNYSKERIEALISTGVIKVCEIPNLEDLASIYCKKINSHDIVENITMNLDKNVNEFICELGQKLCSNILVSPDSNIAIEILSNEVLNGNHTNIMNYTWYPEYDSSYYIYDGKKKVSVGHDGVSIDRGFRCFNKSLNLDFEKSLEELSATLCIEEGRLTYSFDKENDCYYVYLDKDLVGVWNQDLIENFINEADDMYLAESHNSYDCMDCEDSQPCRFANPTASFQRELLTDKLNLPAFSISRLCEKLGRNLVTVED